MHSDTQHCTVRNVMVLDAVWHPICMCVLCVCVEGCPNCVYAGAVRYVRRNDANVRFNTMSKPFHTININEDVSGQLIYPATGKSNLNFDDLEYSTDQAEPY